MDSCCSAEHYYGEVVQRATEIRPDLLRRSSDEEEVEEKDEELCKELDEVEWDHESKRIYSDEENSDVDDLYTIPPEVNVMYNVNKDAKNLVWWDMNTFPLQDTSRAPQLLDEIKQWLITEGGVCPREGYYGPVKLYAYGDRDKVGSKVWDELVKAGGTYIHVPSQGLEGEDSGEDSCFYRMFTDISISTLHCPPPSNYTIISDDKRLNDVGDSLADEYFDVLLASRMLHRSRATLAQQWIWVDIARESHLIMD